MAVTVGRELYGKNSVKKKGDYDFFVKKNLEL